MKAALFAAARLGQKPNGNVFVMTLRAEAKVWKVHSSTGAREERRRNAAIAAGVYAHAREASRGGVSTSSISE
jgi:hypothetical protein